MKKQIIAFVAAILALISLFAASSSPIPLYARYQESIGLSAGQVSLTAVVYFAGCVLSLLVLSRLSSIIGLTKTGFFALIFGGLGLLILMVLKNPTQLMLARFLQGLACGLASNVFSVYLTETGGQLFPKLTKSLLGSAVFIGLSFGSLFAGSLVQMNPQNAGLVYACLLGLLIFTGFGLAAGQGFTASQAFSWKTLVPHLQIPASSKPYLPVSATVFIGTWVMGGYFQAFSATIARQIFSLDSPVIAGLILTIFMVPNLIGASLGQGLSSHKAKRLGMLGFAACVCLMLLAFSLTNLPLFLLVSFLAGIAQGVCYGAAMQDLLQNLSPNQRSNLMSVIYLISYGGAAIPNFLASFFIARLGFMTISLAYLGLVLLMTVAMLILQSPNEIK